VKADKSFIVASSSNDITAQDVWDVATANITTAGSIGRVFTDNRFIQFNTEGEIQAGSGSNNYKAKLHIYDLSTRLVSPVASPSITLYQPDGTVGAGPTNMTKNEKGVYSYQTTLGSGATLGRWEAIVTIETVSGNSVKTSGYFEVEGSPARVTINSITDNTVPSITANFAIANEGSTGFEYQYEYCVVTTIGNVCGGGDDVAYASAAEFIEPGVEEQFNKTLTVNNAGTYFWKVAVYWGTEKSVAVLQFNAVSEEGPTPTPAPGGGGGGGPALLLPPSSDCSGADFNNDGIVNSVDFSIMLFFWKTQPPFANPCVDINKDGQVNSIDFSIMLFQWGKTI
ncbi:MAG: dockerin type I domain-containing protein, partial [Candidatus Paceibacterota bacterium]